MQATLSLFRYLLKNIPPLVPEELVFEMHKTLAAFEKNKKISLDAIENAMITYGYLLWPFKEVYKEFLLHAEEKMGEHFLLPKLSPELQHRYGEFKKLGGTLQELRVGKHAQFFSPEERAELCIALIGMQTDVQLFAKQHILGVDRKKYLKKVEDFKKIVEEIKQHLHELRTVADHEEDHPMLAQDIRSRVRGFEESLCLLGEQLNYQAVCHSLDYFKGRKEHLTRMKGIHLPLEIDFYNE